MTCRTIRLDADTLADELARLLTAGWTIDEAAEALVDTTVLLRRRRCAHRLHQP